MANEGFLNRWSRLKRDSAASGAPEGDAYSKPASASVPGSPPPPQRAQAEQGEPAGRPDEALPAAQFASMNPAAGQPGRGNGLAGSVPAAQEAPALPTLESLGFDSDYSPFMRGDVDPGLRTSALKKLFADPHFNRMDGLDIYIDDYSKPDPMPRAMLARLNQSRLLGLFEEEDEVGRKDGTDRDGGEGRAGREAEEGEEGREAREAREAREDGAGGTTARDAYEDPSAAGSDAGTRASPAASDAQAQLKTDEARPAATAALDGAASPAGLQADDSIPASAPDLRQQCT